MGNKDTGDAMNVLELDLHPLRIDISIFCFILKILEYNFVFFHLV